MTFSECLWGVPPHPAGQGSRSGAPGLGRKMAQQERAAQGFKLGKRTL